MSRLRERLYKEYGIEKLGYDCMGYEFRSKSELSTHHIIPRFQGGETKKNNLSILNRNSSHNYIHLIQDYDYKTFLQISKVLFEEAKTREITMEHLAEINDLLDFFEDKFKNEESRNGSPLIKPEFKTRILKP